MLDWQIVAKNLFSNIGSKLGFQVNKAIMMNVVFSSLIFLLVLLTYAFSLFRKRKTNFLLLLALLRQ